jgi:hypothetical protein
MLSLETIRFANEHEALLVHVRQDTPADAIIAALKLPRPRALICLNGGTADLSETLKTQLRRLLVDGLARVAAENAITLVTGGTDAGIFSLLGEGLEKWGRQVPCLGVTPSAPVTWPGRVEGETPPEPHSIERGTARSTRGRSEGETSLEPHHSHFIVVDGKDWGDETRTMYSVVQALSQDCPSIAIFAGGGDVTLREMRTNVEQGREMILIAGSGRSTDAVLDIRAGAPSSDQPLQETASKGRIARFEIDGSPEQFLRLLKSCISPASPNPPAANP